MKFLASFKLYLHQLACAALALAALGVTLPEQPYADQPTTLTIGWGEWAPYSYTDKRGELRGLEVEIAESVFDRAGYQLDWKKLPWKRHLVMLENGEIDVASAASWSQEREIYAHYSIPYRSEEVVLLLNSKAAATHPIFRSPDDILQSDLKNLGASLGFYYGEKLEALEDSFQVNSRLRHFENNEHMYSLLLTNRLQGIFVDRTSAHYYYEPLGKANEVEVALQISTNDTHIMFSKVSVSADIVDTVNKALHSAIADGTIDKIIEKYLKTNQATDLEPPKGD